jgi:hypothetical protein
MADRELAARRNKARADATIRALADGERNRVFRDPDHAFRIFSDNTAVKLSALSRSAACAIAFFDKAVARRNAGELDGETFYAETVATKVLVSLSDSLHTLSRRATDARDIYAVRRTGVVADKLAVLAEGLLRETRYPSEETARKELVGQSIRMARDAYDDAVSGLRGVHLELNVRLADFPAPQP